MRLPLAIAAAFLCLVVLVASVWPFVAGPALAVAFLALWAVGSLFSPYLVDHAETIPAALRYERVIAMGEAITGLTEGCGARVYRLDADVAEAVSRESLSFLSDVRPAEAPRPDSHYGRYAVWQPTPILRDDRAARSLGGLGCADLDDDLTRALRQAAAREGGFFTYSPEAVLFVIPETRTMVFAHDG